MPKIPFDDWLQDRLTNHGSNANFEQDWERLAPKLNRKKPKRRFLLWIFLMIGVVAGSVYYGLKMNNINDLIEMENHSSDEAIHHDPIVNNLKKAKKLIKPKAEVLSAVKAPISNSVHSPLRHTFLTSIHHNINDTDKAVIDYKIKKSEQFHPIKNIVNDQYISVEEIMDKNEITKRRRLLTNNILPLNVGKITSNPTVVEMTKASIPALFFKMDGDSSSKDERYNRSILNHHFISFNSNIGLYKNKAVWDDNIAEDYINEREKVEELLESYSMSIAYNRQIRSSNWIWNMGLNFNQDSYWLRQSFKDTVDQSFPDKPIQVIKYDNQTIEVLKTGKVNGQQIYTVNRKVLGQRRLFSLQVGIDYKWLINEQHALQFSGGGMMGLFHQYKGLRIEDNAKDIYPIAYTKTVKSKNIWSSFYLGLNYNYRMNNQYEIVSGIKFQNEITGDRGKLKKWHERRKYYYIGAGINVYLN